LFTLKIIAKILAFIGILIVLFDLLGYLNDEERIDFYTTLLNTSRCSPDHPGAVKFLADFFYNNAPSAAEARKPIKEIGLSGFFSKSGELKSYISGYAVVRNELGEHTGKIASIEEIRSWAYASSRAQWIGWIIILIGFILEVAIFTRETQQMKQSKNS